MDKKRIKKSLLDWGLSENEAALYLSSVGLGPTTVLALSRDSGVSRTNVYAVMESLREKGLLSTEVRGFKKLYRAESPAALKQVIEQKKEEFESLLPQLLSMYTVGGEGDTIKYYEGETHIPVVYNQLLQDLRSGDDYFVISNDEEWYALNPTFFDSFIENRGKMRLNVKLLLQDTPAGRRFVEFQRNFNFEARLLPGETYLSTTLIITSSRVLVHQLKSPILLLVIENKSIIQMHRECFNIMWQALK
jgi:HTH-type transcriptional regulator, sugar sensing transcriptional regulator